MIRNHPVVARAIALCAVAAATACTATSTITTDEDGTTDPSCTSDCTGSSGSGSSASGGASSSGGSSSGASPIGNEETNGNGKKDGTETDVDCGGESSQRCDEGKGCEADEDCAAGVCSYAKKCIAAPSCRPHLGGDTCGPDEVEMLGTGGQDSCCRTLEVTGYTDPAHPGKKVYLDKYEITAGRIREWIAAMTKQYNGQPDVKTWIETHRPEIWDDAWNDFLPTGWEGPTKVINRRLLGDPRPEDYGWGVGPGVILPPPTDEPRNMGVNYQFNSEVYVDLHGSNCGVWDDTYGFPTYYYPPDILARDGQLPRADGIGNNGQKIPAQELLDVKAMNCVSNAMLAAFCAWDGGQLATDEVLDYVTSSPASYGYEISGCGIQHDNHGDLLNNDMSRTVQTGGTCPSVPLINATFDAGDNLPVKDSPLNEHHYHYPDLGNVTHDKAWQVSAPGRASSAKGANGAAVDAIALAPGAEPWMDLAGNLNETAFDTNGGTFTGAFTLKLRGIGYGSSRSDLNVKEVKGETIRRVQRPEGKAAYTGGRCMRFK